MKIAYEERAFKPETLAVIEQAEAICREYARQGYELTLRQLYYQFVARGLLVNSERSYKNLGSTVDNARMAGLIDWGHIVDRTRSAAHGAHWDSPADIISAAAGGYAIDRWAGQDVRVEVWVEKEALASIVQQVASRWDCLSFACRGYTSTSAMWRAAQRIIQREEPTVLLYLGDHDPSGIDMSRDVEDRLMTFLDHGLGRGASDHLAVNRIALNMDQVERYNPPPNPAKLTDSRSASYVDTYGDSSWELDALPPDVLDALISGHIEEQLNMNVWRDRERVETRDRAMLAKVERHWADIVQYLEDNH